MKWFKKKEKQERQNKTGVDLETFDWISITLVSFTTIIGIGLLALCLGIMLGANFAMSMH